MNVFCVHSPFLIGNIDMDTAAQLKGAFADIGVVGYLVIMIYVAIFGVTIITKFIEKNRKKELQLQRQRERKEAYRMKKEAHAMRRIEHGHRVQNLKARNAYYQERQRYFKERNNNGFKHNSGGGKSYRNRG